VPETVPTYLSAQVRAVEAPLLAAGEPLMMRAAAALADVVREELADAADPRVLVVAGSGDNGGDALFAAASLALDASVDVLLVSTRFHGEGLAAAVAAGAGRVQLPAARDAASDYDVLIDGLVGIGATSGLRGTARSAVEALLPAVRLGRPRVVAVDLPSGLHPDTGEADDAVLPAAVTVTMGAVKAGLVTGRGPELCGRVVLVDIGLGEGLRDAVGEGVVDRVVRG
jgi:NAD(P)H-hydrate epimerase